MTLECCCRRPHEFQFCRQRPAYALCISYLPKTRTLLLVLSLKFLSPVISLLSYALSAGSESLNASNTSSSHLGPTYKVITSHNYFQNFLSMFNVFAVLALHSVVTNGACLTWILRRRIHSFIIRLQTLRRGGRAQRARRFVRFWDSGEEGEGRKWMGRTGWDREFCRPNYSVLPPPMPGRR